MPEPEHIESWLTAILARPLFSPTRRPAQEAASRAGPAKLEAAPRLAGVMVSAAGRQAIFEVLAGKPVIARVGDKVGPYLVRAIDAGRVTVAGPEGVVVLHPAFANMRTEAVAAPAPAPSMLDRFIAGQPAPTAVPNAETLRALLAKQMAEKPK